MLQQMSKFGLKSCSSETFVTNFNPMKRSPVYAGNTRYILLTAHSLCEQAISDLPGKHSGVLLLVLADRVHHMGGRHLRFAAPYHTCLEVSRLVEPEIQRGLGENDKFAAKRPHIWILKLCL